MLTKNLHSLFRKAREIDINIKNDKQVTLSTFLNTSAAKNLILPSENYWRLIGRRGTVVAQERDYDLPRHALGRRVLVQFSECMSEQGLTCHNEIPNSLWILISDLCPIPEDQ